MSPIYYYKNADSTADTVFPQPGKNLDRAEFSAVPLTMYRDLTDQAFDSISALLESYYASKNTLTRIRQKSSDLRRIVQTVQRSRKKYDLQSRQLADTEKREKYQIWGELIHTYGYGVPEGAKSMQALNYYTNEEVTIPLDPTLSAHENAKKYFDKYGKLKRTFEAVTALLPKTRAEVERIGIRADGPGYGSLRGGSGANQGGAHRIRLHPPEGRWQKGEDHFQALSLSLQRRL
ncbi:MAG: NFACT family protein [Eubacteriales bacterium]